MEEQKGFSPFLVQYRCGRGHEIGLDFEIDTDDYKKAFEEAVKHYQKFLQKNISKINHFSVYRWNLETRRPVGEYGFEGNKKHHFKITAVGIISEFDFKKMIE